MTTSIVHTTAQEEGIAHYRKKYNAEGALLIPPRAPISISQYADKIVLEWFEGIASSAQLERDSHEIINAFKAASPANKAIVRTTLGIV